jgi:Domain of unknown function (DUF4263)
MAILIPMDLSKKQVEADLKDFKQLLNDPNTPDLDEAKHILPFFRARPHLCAFMGTYNPNIVNYRRISTASEFDIFGDHIADLAVGDTVNHEYCFIEFEDAKATSVFKKKGKTTPEWSTRFEHGFSQLVDWILWIEKNQGTPGFLTRFNAPSIRYNTLLVIGRDKYLTNQGLRDRMNWRTDHVVIASKKFHCITFDKLFEDLALRVDILKG